MDRYQAGAHEKVPGLPPQLDDSAESGTIILGKPIHDFESRPPTAPLYRADTVIDGWASEHFLVRCASVRGYNHRWNGAPRQDDLAVALHPPSGALMFAVADGLSSAPRSQEGATTACDAAIAWLSYQLDSESPGRPMGELISHAALTLVQWARGGLPGTSEDAGEVERLFSTTLVAGLVMPGPEGSARASLVRAGDSGSWLLRDGRFVPVLANKTGEDADGAIVDSGVIAPLPSVPADLPEPTHIDLGPGDVLLVGTDGFGDPLGSGRGEVGRFFAEQFAEPPAPLTFARLLDFSRETYDDDRTLVAIWPVSAS
jgi:Protein phosphatase 2C